MSISRIFLIGLATAALVTAQTKGDQTSGANVERDDYLGCWQSTAEPSGIIVQYDPREKRGYGLSEEFVQMYIEPVEGGDAFRYLIKGGEDTWSETRKYYIPTRYFVGVFDPVQRVLIQGVPGNSSSTFYLVGENKDKLIFVHYSSTSKSADMAVRHLDKVDCDVVTKKREKNMKTLENFDTSEQSKELGD